MTTVKKLEVLLEEANANESVNGAEGTAKYLATHNVLVAPCKINQPVYRVSKLGVTKEVVASLVFTGFGFNVKTSAYSSEELVIDKDVFFDEDVARKIWVSRYGG